MKQLVRLLLSTLGLSLLVLTTAESAGTQLAAKSHSTSAPSLLTPDPPRVPVPTVVRPSALNQHVLDLAMMAATCAESRDLVDSPKTLTIIDYSLPSTSPRLLGAGPRDRTHPLRGSCRARSRIGRQHGDSLLQLCRQPSVEPWSFRHRRHLRRPERLFDAADGLEPGVNDLREPAPS